MLQKISGLVAIAWIRYFKNGRCELQKKLQACKQWLSSSKKKQKQVDIKGLSCMIEISRKFGKNLLF